MVSKRLFRVIYTEQQGNLRPGPLPGGEEPPGPVTRPRASLFPTGSHTSKAGLVLTYSASSMATGHLYCAVLKRQMSAYWRTGEEEGNKVG